MELATHNWVSTTERAGQRLALNLLTRAADLVAAEDAPLFRGEISEPLSDAECDELVGRGYAFPSRSEEDRLLAAVDRLETTAARPVVVLHLGVPSARESGPDAVARVLEENLPGTEGRIPVGELVVYGETVQETAPGAAEVGKLLDRARALGYATSVVVAAATIPRLESLLREPVPDLVVLAVPPHAVDQGEPFRSPVQETVIHLLDRGCQTRLDIRLDRQTIDCIVPFVHRLIARGWPMQENFTCSVAPAESLGCLFGQRYSLDPDLLPALFRTLGAHPETQFLSLDGWAGARTLHSLVWRGKPPMPSLRFCRVGEGLVFLSTNGDQLSCDDLFGGRPRNRPATTGALAGLATAHRGACRDCRFFPACGGGCRREALVRGAGRPTCPPMEDLFDVAVDGWMDELIERAAFLGTGDPPGGATP